MHRVAVSTSSSLLVSGLIVTSTTTNFQKKDTSHSPHICCGICLCLVPAGINRGLQISGSAISNSIHECVSVLFQKRVNTTK